MGTTKTETVGTRLDPAIAARLDKIAERLTSTALAGMKVSRGDILRALVLRALPDMERELGMVAAKAEAAMAKIGEDIHRIVNEPDGKPAKKTAKKRGKAAR